MFKWSKKFSLFLYIFYFVEYLKLNKNDEIKKNNKNIDENGCYRFFGFDVYIIDYFIFFKFEW